MCNCLSAVIVTFCGLILFVFDIFKYRFVVLFLSCVILLSLSIGGSRIFLERGMTLGTRASKVREHSAGFDSKERHKTASK